MTAASDSSRISTARSTSSSEIVSGGAIRTQFAAPPLPPRTRFTDSPRRSHSSPSASPSASAGRRESRSSTSSMPDQQAEPADVADRLVARLELAQMPHQTRPLPRRARRQPLLLHDLEHRRRRRRRQWIRDVRGDVDEAALEAAGLDLGARHDGADRHPAAERLRQHEEVRHDAVVLEAVHRPEAAEARLALVEHDAASRAPRTARPAARSSPAAARSRRRPTAPARPRRPPARPTDAWSKRSKPASRHVQSHAPSHARTGQRYSYGAGIAKPPGSVGP